MLKILVADDSLIVRYKFKESLKKLGYQEILEASNGKEVLRLLSEDNGIGVVLLDWNMPEMNGIEVLETLRADTRYKGLPVVMLTANNAKSQVLEAIKKGADHYLLKPLNEIMLKQILDKIATTRT